MNAFNPTYIITLRANITYFLDGSAQLFKMNDGKPMIGSTAAYELSQSMRPELILTALSTAQFLIDYSSEQLSLFVKSLHEPIESLAAWTCVRSMLESCALAAWMVDPDIDHTERVARQFAHRYQGLEQQIKFGRAASLDAAELDAIEKRIDDVESSAMKLSYPEITNSQNKRIGIGRRMPGATQIINLMLNEEKTYRLLSAVAHGHMWALINLGYRPTDDQSEIAGVGFQIMKKTVLVHGMAYIGLSATKAIVRPIWYLWRYMGWEVAPLIELFEHVFDGLQANNNSRFWRPPGTTT